MLHGRSGDAAGMLDLPQRFTSPGVAYLAPEAPDCSWYPRRFMDPVDRNQPQLDESLAWVDSIINDVMQDRADRRRLILLGFSQGACLALEYAVRNATRYGAIIGFTGGLIGPPGTVWDYSGAFDSTPVFLGCSDVDAWTPEARVHETAAVMEGLGAVVETQIYPGMGHVINDEEMETADRLIAEAGKPDPARDAAGESGGRGTA